MERHPPLAGEENRKSPGLLEEMLMMGAGAGETACSNPKEWQGISLLADELRGSWEPCSCCQMLSQSRALHAPIAWSGYLVDVVGVGEIACLNPTDWQS